MNWIKQNPFLSALLGGTIALCAILTFIAMKGGSKYQDAKIRFDDAFVEVNKAETLRLYPLAENRQAKKKALDDYRESIDELRGLYSKFQLDPSVKITTQQFTDRLIEANNEVEDAFKAADSKLPADFLMGFESYRGQLAKSGSTALLDYQLNAVRHILLGMAEARPSEFIRIYREKIPEENDKVYEPAKNEVARKFGYEIVFKGSEASVRDFISKLGEKELYYCVIRSIRINNERDTPPRISDAKFETPKEAAPAAENPFKAFFPDEEPAPPVEAPEPEEEAPPGAVPQGAALEGAALGEAAGGIAPPVIGEEVIEPAPAPALPEAPPVAGAVDTTRILYQVLGDEELQVFVRFDILLFLPTTELPKP